MKAEILKRELDSQLRKVSDQPKTDNFGQGIAVENKSLEKQAR